MVNKEFEAKISELDNVNSFIEEQLESYDCPMKVLMQINVALEEIFVNVANYAYGDKEGKALVSVDVNDGVVSISISDSGIPFDPLAKADPNISLSAEERSIGGLGIYMTKKCMDEVSYKYENNHNILTMKKKIN